MLSLSCFRKQEIHGCPISSPQPTNHNLHSQTRLISFTMSKVLFTVAVPHKGENRRPSFVVSTNNLNAVQISRKGVKLGNTNYNGGFKRFEYSVGGNQAVTKFSLVVNTSALLPHITWATGLPLPIIGGKKKNKDKEKRSSSADAGSRRPMRPQMGRRASSMDRIEETPPRRRIEDGRSERRSSRYEDEEERRRITDGVERRSRRDDDDAKWSRRSKRGSSLYDDDDKYSRRPSRRHDDGRKSRCSEEDKRSRYSDDIYSSYKPMLSNSTRYGDTRRYDRYKNRLAPLSEVDAYERKYGREARRKRYKRQEKYDGGEIVDDGPDGVDADDHAGDAGADDGDVGDVDAGGDGGD